MHENTVASFVPGTILHHAGRDHYYLMFAKTKVKLTGCEPSWQDAWIYHRVGMNQENVCFSWEYPIEFFTRLFRDFDEDWSYVTS